MLSKVDGRGPIDPPLCLRLTFFTLCLLGRSRKRSRKRSNMIYFLILIFINFISKRYSKSKKGNLRVNSLVLPQFSTSKKLDTSTRPFVETRKCFTISSSFLNILWYEQERSLKVSRGKVSTHAILRLKKFFFCNIFCKDV